MNTETQQLIDQLRDQMAGMTEEQRGRVYLSVMDGYLMQTFIGSDYQFRLILKEK